MGPVKELYASLPFYLNIYFPTIPFSTNIYVTPLSLVVLSALMQNNGFLSVFHPPFPNPPRNPHFQPQCLRVRLGADIWKTWRCFQDSWAFSLFSVENSLRHPWSLLRLPWASHRSSPQHSWWALRCFHFQLPFALFHGWNRHKSCWMNSKIQGHANSFNKQIWTTFGNKRLWHLEKHMSDVHTDSEQI